MNERKDECLFSSELKKTNQKNNNILLGCDNFNFLLEIVNCLHILNMLHHHNNKWLTTKQQLANMHKQKELNPILFWREYLSVFIPSKLKTLHYFFTKKNWQSLKLFQRLFDTDKWETKKYRKKVQRSTNLLLLQSLNVTILSVMESTRPCGVLLRRERTETAFSQVSLRRKAADTSEK